MQTTKTIAPPDGTDRSETPLPDQNETTVDDVMGETISIRAMYDFLSHARGLFLDRTGKSESRRGGAAVFDGADKNLKAADDALRKLWAELKKPPTEADAAAVRREIALAAEALDQTADALDELSEECARGYTASGGKGRGHDGVYHFSHAMTERLEMAATGLAELRAAFPPPPAALSESGPPAG